MLARDVGPRAARLELEVLLPVRARARALAELLAGHRQVEVRVGEARVALERALEVRRPRRAASPRSSIT